MITRTPNDFMYYYYNLYGADTINIGGGRFKIPVWLIWATYGVVAGIIFIIESIVGVSTGSIQYGPPWIVTAFFVGIPLVFMAIYWPLYGVYAVIREWTKVIRSGL